MGRRDRAPAPFDVQIDSVGYVEARGGGAPRQSEHAAASQAGQRDEDSLILDDWSNGVGLRKYTSDAQTLGMLYYAAASGTTGAAGDTLGGGADGAYGPLIPGPFLNVAAVGSAGQVVRDLCEFTPSGGAQVFLAAIEHVIYKSTSPIWAASAAAITTETTTDIRRLVQFAGTNGMLRCYALCAGKPIFSSLDGTTWTSVSGQQEYPSAFVFTHDVGASYTDATADVAGGGGMAALGGLDTAANGDWILIGHTHPFLIIEWTMTNTNGNAATATVQFWDGVQWTNDATVANGKLTDNTVSGGHSLGTAGPATMLYNRPPAWVAAPLTELGATGSGVSLSRSYYWARVSFSAALDGSTDADTVQVTRYQEGLCGAVLGDQFAVVGPDSATIYWTRTGGVTPTWLSNFDPLPAGGSVIDMVAAADTWWVLGTNHLSAVGPDGSVRSYFPELFQGGAADTDAAFLSVWLGKLLFSLGRGGLFLLDPSTGDLQVIGPERQFLNDLVVAPYTTAVVGDRTHRLYAGWKTPSGKAWLAGWGAYKLGSGAGVPEYERLDSWHMLGDLSTGRTIRTMATWTSAGQPCVALGDDGGTVIVFKTPIGASPLLASSGYSYSTRQVELYFPTFGGLDPARQVEAYASTLAGRNLSASRYAALSARDFTAGGSYAARATTTTNGNARQAWATPYAGYGLEMVLVMTMTSDTATPWLIDRLLVHQQAELLDSQALFDVTVLVDDDVVCQDGRVIPKSTSDWATALDTLCAKKIPVALVRAGGQTEYVLVRARGLVELRADAWGNRKRAVSLTFASAEGAPT